jgi:hypothetical protein
MKIQAQVESKVGLDDTEFNAATPDTSDTAISGGTFIGQLDFSINFRQRSPPWCRVRTTTGE